MMYEMMLTLKYGNGDRHDADKHTDGKGGSVASGVIVMTIMVTVVVMVMVGEQRRQQRTRVRVREKWGWLRQRRR